MAKEIRTVDDLQSELNTLRSLLSVVSFMARELPYPKEAKDQRTHDELTAVAMVAADRAADLDASVARNYSALAK